MCQSDPWRNTAEERMPESPEGQPPSQAYSSSPNAVSDNLMKVAKLKKFRVLTLGLCLPSPPPPNRQPMCPPTSQPVQMSQSRMLKQTNLDRPGMTMADLMARCKTGMANKSMTHLLRGPPLSLKGRGVPPPIGIASKILQGEFLTGNLGVRNFFLM